MGWSTPKTNWVSTDRFNLSDYNRIKNNLEYLHEYAEKLYSTFSIQDMGEDKTDYADLLYADEFNAFENNLEKISQNIFPREIGDKETFEDNGTFIDWAELNRIESAMVTIQELLDAQKNALRRLSFRLGDAKGVRV